MLRMTTSILVVEDMVAMRVPSAGEEPETGGDGVEVVDDEVASSDDVSSDDTFPLVEEEDSLLLLAKERIVRKNSARDRMQKRRYSTGRTTPDNECINRRCAIGDLLSSS